VPVILARSRRTADLNGVVQHYTTKVKQTTLIRKEQLDLLTASTSTRRADGRTSLGRYAAPSTSRQDGRPLGRTEGGSTRHNLCEVHKIT
jgi:hypothetical protein